MLIEVPLPKAKYSSSRTIRADKLLSLVHSKGSLWLLVSWLQFSARQSASACHGDDHLLFYLRGCSVMDCVAGGFTEGWDLFIWCNPLRETANASCSTRLMRNFFRFGWQPGLPPRSGRPSQRSTLRVLWSCPPTLGPRCLELTEWMSTEHSKNLSLSCHIKASRKPNLGCVSKRKLFGWNLLRKQLGVRCLLLCMLHCIVTV